MSVERCLPHATSVATASATILPVSSLSYNQNNRCKRTGSGNDVDHFGESSFSDLHPRPQPSTGRRHSISSITITDSSGSQYQHQRSAEITSMVTSEKNHSFTDNLDQTRNLNNTTKSDVAKTDTTTNQSNVEVNEQHSSYQSKNTLASKSQSTSEIVDIPTTIITTTNNNAAATSSNPRSHFQRSSSCRRPLSELLTRAPSFYDTPMESYESDEYSTMEIWSQPEKRRKVNCGTEIEPSSYVPSTHSTTAISHSISRCPTRMMSVEMADAPPLTLHQHMNNEEISSYINQPPVFTFQNPEQSTASISQQINSTDAYTMSQSHGYINYTSSNTALFDEPITVNHQHFLDSDQPSEDTDFDDDENDENNCENHPSSTLELPQPEILDWNLCLKDSDTDDDDDLIVSLNYVINDQMRAQPDPNYAAKMCLPSDFEKFRRRVVIWTIQTSGVLGYHKETAYLAVNFIDRYLSQVQLRDKLDYVQNEVAAARDLQRLAVTALLMSAKLTEENRNPCASDFTCFCDGGTTGQEIKRMEIEFSKALNYQYRPVTPHRVIGEISAAIPALSSVLGDELIRTAFRYIAMASIDYRALRFKPAILAVAALDRALMDFHKEHPSLTQHKSLSSFLPRASLARLVKAGLTEVDECAVYLNELLSHQWFSGLAV